MKGMALAVVLITMVLMMGTSALSNRPIPEISPEKELAPYPLPDTVVEKLTTAASDNDILMLGECHGTKEIPALAASLIPELSKRGYGVLALELPNDEVKMLFDWATGKSKNVAPFFLMPPNDGRANVQVLAMIRYALSPPYHWKLVCFDQSLEQATADFEDFQRRTKDRPKIPPNPDEITEDVVEIWQTRDAAMAKNFNDQLKQFSPCPKVLVICGGAHNRITSQSPIPQFKKLWPSFAAKFHQDVPSRKVCCVNMQFHGGAIFNGGKELRVGGRPIDQPEIHEAIETGYHWELKLLKATPATFLTPPNPSPPETDLK